MLEVEELNFLEGRSKESLSLEHYARILNY